ALLVGAALLVAQGLKLGATGLGWKIEAPEQDMHRPRPEEFLLLMKRLWELVKDQHLLLAFLALNLAAALLVLAARRRPGGAPGPRGARRWRSCGRRRATCSSCSRSA